MGRGTGRGLWLLTVRVEGCGVTPRWGRCHQLLVGMELADWCCKTQNPDVVGNCSGLFFRFVMTEPHTL